MALPVCISIRQPTSAVTSSISIDSIGFTLATKISAGIVTIGLGIVMTLLCAGSADWRWLFHSHWYFQRKFASAASICIDRIDLARVNSVGSVNSHWRHRFMSTALIHVDRICVCVGILAASIHVHSIDSSWQHRYAQDRRFP